MLKKSISAALVVVMMAWVEMAVAPMLAMHVWYGHPAHEMAANMAGHYHHDAMPAEHPCCPKIRKTENTVLLEFAASSLPCQDQHRCCFLRGPQNLPAPVNAGQKHSQEISLEEIAELAPAPIRARIPPETQVSSGSPPELLGMILRV
jgi:hypothetical protein